MTTFVHRMYRETHAGQVDTKCFFELTLFFSHAHAGAASNYCKKRNVARDKVVCQRVTYPVRRTSSRFAHQITKLGHMDSTLVDPIVRTSSFLSKSTDKSAAIPTKMRLRSRSTKVCRSTAHVFHVSTYTINFPVVRLCVHSSRRKQELASK